MPPIAPNAAQQNVELKKLIAKDRSDHTITVDEVRKIIALARRENVQGGELATLRQLANDPALTPRARSFLVPRVDQMVPTGAPTAHLAAILFRLDPNAGRKQLLHLLDSAKNPVHGGPKTFVVTGYGPP